MSNDKAFDGSVLRVFEARAKPGCADSLTKKFATTSVDVVRNQPGNQGHFFGERISDKDNVFLFVSVWRDLNAVKTRFGDEWENSFLPPGYSELIDECSIKHFALKTDWHLISETATPLVLGQRSDAEGVVLDAPRDGVELLLGEGVTRG